MLASNIITAVALVALGAKAQTYSLNFTYDYTNWRTAWTFEDGPDPTHGLVDYQNLADADAAGLFKIINNQVYMGVDNSTVIPAGSPDGRKSIWLESVAMYDHYLLIADFEHMPGSDCGTWPGFWSINNANALGEIDIIEGANQQLHNCMTLHTKDECTFSPRNETGNSNGMNCGLQQGDTGCDTSGGLYGTAFNKVGGGVYATLWNSDAIQVFFWERSQIPEDIASGKPMPQTWGIPLAQFAGAAGGCDIDTNFQSQTIFFDTTFCGANAGGPAWTEWSTCASTTGYATCEEYVQAEPEAFDDAYWLINHVQVYMEDSSSLSPPVAPPVAPSSTLVTSLKPTTTSEKPTPPATMKLSVSGSCGPGVTCKGSSFGECCSRDGYCGSDSYYCGAGCQIAFGSCTNLPSYDHVQTTVDPNASTSSAASPSGMKVSDDGSCGGSTHTTCQNSVFGNCCSQWGFCGSSDAYCGNRCQSEFGSCA